MRKILAITSITIGLFVAGFSLASAQSLPAICSVLPLLEQGSNGSTVTILQQFLGAQGDLNVSATGFFGPLTEAALVQFQNSTGIAAQAGGNGLFGQFTRAYILSHFCQSGGSGPAPSQTELLTVNVTSGQAPLTVTFSGIGSTINFGDGTNQSSQNGGALGSINHTYTAAGNYVVTSGNLQVTISVSGNATTPAGSISSFTNSGPAPLTVTFYVSCTNASTYDVSYGDGTDLGSANSAQVLCNGSLQSFTHTYNSAGSYTATLDLIQQQSNGTFVTQTGGTVGITATGASTNSNNSVSFTASPTSGASPLAVTFSAVSATNLTGDTVTFGDGTSGTMAQSDCNEVTSVNGGGSACSYSVSHTYNSAGTFPATLTGSGNTTLGTASVTVSGSGGSGSCSAPSQDLSLGNSDADTNGQVTVLQNFLVFEGSTIYPAQLVTGFFGNATLTGVINFQGKYGIQQTGFVGPLTLAAIAQACNGIAPPTSSSFSFTASPSSGNAPLAVTFTATNVETPNSGSYVVAFGDGSQGTMSGATSSMTVSHTYSQNGTYAAQLLIQQNLCGGSVTLSGCVSDLQVGTTTVTVGNGVTTTGGTAGQNTVYVFSNSCNSASTNPCGVGYGVGSNAAVVETFQVFSSQQSGTVPLYICSNPAGSNPLGGQYGTLGILNGEAFVTTGTNMPTGAQNGTPGVCTPGNGMATGGIWGYVYPGPQSGSLELYLVDVGSNGGAWDADNYVMTTRPWSFTSGRIVGSLGYVPSAAYPGSSTQNGGSF
jgi:PKD repeat protein